MPIHATPNEIHEHITAVLRDVFEDPSLDVRDELTAADVPAWDSLNHINLIVALEREFRVRFTAGEAIGMKNIGELKALIARKLNAG